MIKKNKIIEIEISGNEYPDMGTACFSGEKIYVKNALAGQALKVRTYRRKKRNEGELVEVLRRAANETAPGCDKFGVCGGCAYQTIPYEDELSLKKSVTLKLFEKMEIGGFEFLGMEGSPEQNHYRNKMEYSFGDTGIGSEISLGLRKRNSYYEVSYPDRCTIADNDFAAILNAALEFFRKTGEKFYHRIKKDGSLRHLVIRKGKKTGEILVNLVTAGTLDKNCAVGFVKALTALTLDGEITGVLHTTNSSAADVVKCDSLEILYGRDYFFEIINGFRFKISAFSFFQTNSLAAERLYQTVKSFIPDTSGEIFDLYCGTGTIAQIVSQKAERVTGVEISGDAIAAAKENAEINSIENCRFIVGDVLDKIAELTGFPDTIILDPPRDGLNPKLIEKIINFGAQNIVYVSCKPTSLVRDLKSFLGGGYQLEKVKLHDLFPRTYHIECVALMSRMDD